MMHVMQPVVLDSDWSATHRTLDTNLASSVTLVDRPAAAANLSSPGVNDTIQAISTSSPSFSALNRADVQLVHPPNAQYSTASALANQSMTTTSTNPLKPPKKPLTPYMRFSQAVSCFL